MKKGIHQSVYPSPAAVPFEGNILLVGPTCPLPASSRQASLKHVRYDSIKANSEIDYLKRTSRKHYHLLPMWTICFLPRALQYTASEEQSISGFNCGARWRAVLLRLTSGKVGASSHSLPERFWIVPYTTLGGNVD